MSERSVKVHADDCPWITKDLKRLILQRQKAFTAAKMSRFKLLRNKVNRERKRCRKSYIIRQNYDNFQIASPMTGGEK